MRGLASTKFQTRFVSGRRDVMKDCRDGEHTLIWRKACCAESDMVRRGGEGGRQARDRPAAGCGLQARVRGPDLEEQRVFRERVEVRRDHR